MSDSHACFDCRCIGARLDPPLELVAGCTQILRDSLAESVTVHSLEVRRLILCDVDARHQVQIFVLLVSATVSV